MEKIITINGVKSRIFETGDPHGKPIVLMHGWGCQASTLASIERMVAPNCRVINVDFPGFGESAEPQDIWGVEDYEKWLVELLKALNIDSPILLGHSFGGRVALLYASKHKVDKLILVDAAGVKPKRSLKYYVKVYSFKTLKQIAKLFLNKEKAQAFVDKQRAKRGSQDYASASSKMRAIMSKVVNEDLRCIMPKISAPTLLIWGENDTATPMRDAKIMERLIPDAGLVSFPGCGHYSFLDNPVQFAAVIKSFVSS